MSALTDRESRFLTRKLRRTPNQLEKDIVGAEWSEHCSYKSSKKFIKLLPSTGSRVVRGPGYDAGVLDMGNDHVLTIHIESHNHPSAIEPYGGAATGVGGVIRDILAMGTRPIALFDALRFGHIVGDAGNIKSSIRSKWLLRYAVRGIADYGNCVGVPTVGGEVEFDSSFADYCLIDVAAIGFARRDAIVSNAADVGDLLVLVGNPTGRDGIRGASFASTKLETDDRSAVQIPDPFLEKLLVEATLEAIEKKCVKALKDLGGGGLACCLSEVSSDLRKGFDVELQSLHVTNKSMLPSEIMISESQERMLFIIDKLESQNLKSILNKYEIQYSIIGKVIEGYDLIIRFNGKILAHMPSYLVSHAPLIRRKAKYPQYLRRLKKSFATPKTPNDLNRAMLLMLSNPTIASKGWIYQQYDSEVGIRTVIKPGQGDSSVLKLENGKYVSMKLDGNSKQCYLNPYQGTLGCLSEACRNVICTGGAPIAIVDHLQFGDPENPEVFWGFKQSVRALTQYCTFTKIPVIGGKVSLYNETQKGPIKPSPIVGAVGLIDKKEWITDSALKPQDSIYIIGSTDNELGGSEYYEYYHHLAGGEVPDVNFSVDKANGDVVSRLIRRGIVNSAHDCSKGGLGVALAEMAIQGGVGIDVNLGRVPNRCSSVDNLLFSETNSRYVIGTRQPALAEKALSRTDSVIFAHIGYATQGKSSVRFTIGKDETIIDIPVKELIQSFEVLNRLMDNR